MTTNLASPIDTDHIMDVRPIPCSIKHGMILKRWGELPVGEYFVLLNDHDEEPRSAPIPYFRGPPGAGKHLWSHLLATRLNRRHLVVELNALVAEYGSLELGLRVVFREAKLQDAMLCSTAGRA